MNLIMIYDQIQAGLGTKDDKMLPLGAVREAIGPAVMMNPYLKQNDGHVMATLYCGNGFYLADPKEVSRKLCAMVKKLSPDLVMCGPAFNFLDYGIMCAQVAAAMIQTTGIPAIAAMAEENTAAINAYKALVPIVKMPKKGDPGLNEALKNMCLLAKAITSGQDTAEMMKAFCF